jgi:hypothetical protein
MTNGASKPNHVEPDELIDYFTSCLPSNREREIEEHVAGCDACTEFGRSINFLAHAVPRLTTKELAKAFASQALVSALSSASYMEGNGSLRSMYDRCIRGVGRTTVGTLKTIVRSTGAEFLFDASQPHGGWRFSPAFALRSLDPGTNRTGSKAILEAPGAQSVSAATVRRIGDTITVKIADWPVGSSPLAILADIGQTGVSVCGKTIHAAEDQYEITFEGIKSGPYLILFQLVEKGQFTP